MLFSIPSRELAYHVAASWAALNLGCALMLRSTDELVRRDFADEARLQWPRSVYALKEPLAESDLRSVNGLANGLTKIMGTNSSEFLHVIENFRDNLFGNDPKAAVAAALALLLASMEHFHPLVRVSAAAGVFSLVHSPLRTDLAFKILTNLLDNSSDRLIQNLAFLGLASPLRNMGGAGLVQAGTHGGRVPEAGQPSVSMAKQALLVHGTVMDWHASPQDTWWKPPMGNLHQYLKSGRLPNLYFEADHYRWSGGWNDYAREEAAEKLVDWLAMRHIDEPDIVAHSHGCNVAMLASHKARLNKLVLLSCPVHWFSYWPGNVRQVTSIRINWDLVILGDGGAQRFPNGSGIQEEVLPFWFTPHDATHTPAIWRTQNLDQFV